MPILRRLAAAGYPAVSGDNRGHHMGAAIHRTGGEDLLGGAWWEVFGDGRLDVAAWVDFAAGLGGGRVVLIGKSAGPYKTLWYQAERQDPRVVAMVLASGPTQAYRRVRSNPERTALAERMEAEGRAQDLLPWGSFGGGFTTLSAASYLDRLRTIPDLYGIEHPEDCALARITCPILAFFGTAEPNIGTADDLALIERNARSSPRVTTAMIDGMDHSHTGYDAQLADLLRGWMAEID